MKTHTSKAEKQGKPRLMVWRTLHDVGRQYRVDVFLEISFLELVADAVQSWIDDLVC